MISQLYYLFFVLVSETYGEACQVGSGLIKSEKNLTGFNTIIWNFFFGSLYSMVAYDWKSLQVLELVCDRGIGDETNTTNTTQVLCQNSVNIY